MLCGGGGKMVVCLRAHVESGKIHYLPSPEGMKTKYAVYHVCNIPTVVYIALKNS